MVISIRPKAKEIEDAVYDLKAVNPHKKPVIDTRPPEELMSIIKATGKEVADALAALRAVRLQQRRCETNKGGVWSGKAPDAFQDRCLECRRYSSSLRNDDQYCRSFSRSAFSSSISPRSIPLRSPA